MAENTLYKTETVKNGKVLTIRNAEPLDAENIVEYMSVIGGESDNLTFGPGDLTVTVEEERDFIASTHKDGRSLMLVGVIDEEIACVSSLKCLTRKRVSHNADFSITVLKKYWNLGIGDAMLRAIIDYARQRPDIRNITLGVRMGNDSAIHLYEKHGFTKIGVQKNFFRVGDDYFDAYLMDLYL